MTGEIVPSLMFVHFVIVAFQRNIFSFEIPFETCAYIMDTPTQVGIGTSENVRQIAENRKSN